MFALVNNANVSNFFEVLTSNQTDPDSAPGNGPNAEDDQVTVTIIPNFNGSDPLENRFGQGQTYGDARLYPVPADSYINLRLNSVLEQEEAVISIFNQTGSLVRTQQTAVLKGKNEWNFDLTEFSAGVYFIRLPGQMQTLQFIKL